MCPPLPSLLNTPLGTEPGDGDGDEDENDEVPLTAPPPTDAEEQQSGAPASPPRAHTLFLRLLMFLLRLPTCCRCPVGYPLALGCAVTLVDSNILSAEVSTNPW
eukprot:GHVT01057573.1.p1 GENE.GHVT01057573.1~~GHVT01057573.1.p1  ORF type:complete len:104 (+),score=13.01 GHVT01057573.1:542-853(+)